MTDAPKLKLYKVGVHRDGQRAVIYSGDLPPADLCTHVVRALDSNDARALAIAEHQHCPKYRAMLTGGRVR
jgi:hypothetical protein